MTEWKPIDTAPRDRDILVLFELTGANAGRYAAKACRFEPHTGFYAPCDKSAPELHPRGWVEIPPIPDLDRVKAAIAERQARLAAEAIRVRPREFARVECAEAPPASFGIPPAIDLREVEFCSAG